MLSDLKYIPRKPDFRKYDQVRSIGSSFFDDVDDVLRIKPGEKRCIADEDNWLYI